jgi:acyl-coenzyme A thioesterase PaaI-like protein
LFSYVNSARVGDDLLVTASAREVGERLAFIDCAVTKKSDGALVISGKHTLFLG